MSTLTARMAGWIGSGGFGLCLLLAACGKAKYEPYADVGLISFNENPQTNVPEEKLDSLPATLLELEFRDTDGNRVDLTGYRDQRNVVLIIMRGFPEVCPFCKAQTTILVNSYGEFDRRNAQLLVVYPGPTENVERYIEYSQSQSRSGDIPFPILLDEDLAVVRQLDIERDLARPATYIIDKQGSLRFAYVGETQSDRPSVNAVLNELDKLAGEAGAAQPGS
jgi:peroxiredoxin